MTINAKSASLAEDLEEIRQAGAKREKALDFDAGSHGKLQPSRVLFTRVRPD